MTGCMTALGGCRGRFVLRQLLHALLYLLHPCSRRNDLLFFDISLALGGPSASRPTAFQEGFLDFVQTAIFQLPGLGMTILLRLTL